MKLALVALVALSLAAPGALAEEPDAQRMVVILHPSNGTAAIDRSQLAQIFKGVRRSWNAKLPISLYLPPTTSPAMAALAKEIFKVKRPEDVPMFYSHAVERKIFAAVPRAFPTEADVVKQVAADPGAIAVVSAAQIEDPKSVKMLAVEGL